MSENIKQTILNVAAKTVADRGAQYGSTHDSMTQIANLWSDYMGVHITPFDVANMMSLLKISRSKTGNPRHLDNYVDSAAYSAIAAEMVAYVWPNTQAPAQQAVQAVEEALSNPALNTTP